MIATAADPSVQEVEPTPLLQQYLTVRQMTDRLAEPLGAEDCLLQSMPDASPTKWHLAHTTWFFETFILSAEIPGYRPASPAANFLFNSYYNAIGERIARDRRGMLSRPSLEEIRRYRREIDDRMGDFLAGLNESTSLRIYPTIVLGLNHEQQHQELILTDIKHAFGLNPIKPAYQLVEKHANRDAAAVCWLDRDAETVEIGHDGRGFAFDNENPRHRTLIAAHQLASRPATNAEYLEFMEAGGYEKPEYWLSDGWAARKSKDWEAPLYWERGRSGWQTFTLAGIRPLADEEPVVHVSFYEADAFARWSRARLPTEAEWETAAANRRVSGNFLETGRLHPVASEESPMNEPVQLFGDVWEWTASSYLGYPGYRPAAGALGEYNGKFMCNQFVLRGGSCVSPSSHLRAGYRNFFPPDARWQFTGIRLAR